MKHLIAAALLAASSVSWADMDLETSFADCVSCSDFGVVYTLLEHRFEGTYDPPTPEEWQGLAISYDSATLRVYQCFSPLQGQDNPNFISGCSQPWFGSRGIFRTVSAGDSVDAYDFDDQYIAANRTFPFGNGERYHYLAAVPTEVPAGQAPEAWAKIIASDTVGGPPWCGMQDDEYRP
ncbi:MAG: hypothetical protein QNJ97_17725 [Myxococcota bacterium]|nr:hypothetical protein [Myxococcota bacterium]